MTRKLHFRESFMTINQRVSCHQIDIFLTFNCHKGQIQFSRIWKWIRNVEKVNMQVNNEFTKLIASNLNFFYGSKRNHGLNRTLRLREKYFSENIESHERFNWRCASWRLHQIRRWRNQPSALWCRWVKAQDRHGFPEADAFCQKYFWKCRLWSESIWR